MADDDKPETTGADPAAANDANNTNDTNSTVLTDEQLAAVAALASTNKYAKQSKWTTFKELPREDKWPFFVQHFLLGTVIAAVAVAVVVSLVVTFLTRPPQAELTVAGFGLDDYTSQLDELKSGFVTQRKIDDDRLVQITGTYNIGGNGYTDDSAKVMTMVTAGDINMMIADKDTFAELNARQLVSAMSAAEDTSTLDGFAKSGALVDKQGEPTDDVTQAYGLDLSKSATWTSIAGLPDDMIVGFSNINDGTNRTRAREFVDYLRFE